MPKLKSRQLNIQESVYVFFSLRALLPHCSPSLARSCIYILNFWQQKQQQQRKVLQSILRLCRETASNVLLLVTHICHIAACTLNLVYFDQF